MVLVGEELKITIVINSMNNSITWKTRDYFFKNLHIDDWLKRRTAKIVIDGTCSSKTRG